ncbi:MAG: hypothetical protein D6B27_08530 [Gammaproteobacteria bacterium]|nr:MAG: hypothetical protein D6B27_08530 [Gammaproteobacteria bacterium]
MNLFDVFSERHSYRGRFKDISIPHESLEKIISAGASAPSGKNQQTTDFIAITNKDIIGKIAAMKGCNQAMVTAQAYIVCVIDKEPENVLENHSFQIEDCAAAVENMLLAISGLGLASVWIDGWLRMKGRAGEIAELLHIPESKVARVMLPIGIPGADAVRVKRKPLSERLFFNFYGNTGK